MKSKDKKLIQQKYDAAYEWIKNMPDILWESCSIIHFQRGETIFHMDERISFVYIICNGVVIISNNQLNGNEMCVVFVQDGSTIGEMEALLENKETVYSAKAFTECEMLAVPIEIFRLWISMDIVACGRMAHILAEKLYQSSVSVVQYKNLEAVVRLKILLAKQKTGYIRKTRAELAEACGVSERTINRCINQLKGQDMVTVNRGKIVISAAQLKTMQDSLLEQF